MTMTVSVAVWITVNDDCETVMIKLTKTVVLRMTVNVTVMLRMTVRLSCYKSL